MMYSYEPIYNSLLINESGFFLKDTPLVTPSNNLSVNDKKINCNGKRHITFFDKVTIRETIHVHDYTADERRKSWYNKRELKDIKQHLKKTAVWMLSGKLKIDTEFNCQRGLEYRVGEEAVQRRRRISYALMVVLSEQEEQRTLGKCDPVTISLAYRHVSRVSAAKAYDVGRCDEIEAYHINNCNNRASERGKRKSKWAH
jgi:hypothetical protein